MIFVKLSLLVIQMQIKKIKGKKYIYVYLQIKIYWTFLIQQFMIMTTDEKKEVFLKKWKEL